MTRLPPLLSACLGLLVGALLGTPVGYGLGTTAAEVKAQKALVSQLRAAQKEYDRQVEEGQRAVADLAHTRDQQEKRYEALEAAFREGQRQFRLAAGRAAVQPGCAGPVATEPPAAATPAPSPALAEPELTRGAVWMWNSALTGADVPAGACGAADTSAAACDVGTGLGLEAAWDSHEANARLWAEDRLRHQKLIDFLRSRGGR